MKTTKLLFLFLFLLQGSGLLLAQTYSLPTEEIIFAFDTDKGKTLTICRDKADKYIVYRYGSKKKVELEFPSVKNKESWERFTLSFYFRGGGEENEGMDTNSLTFKNGSYEYTVFDDYVAANGGERTVGISVKYPDGKTKEIKGLIKTVKGTLITLRDHELLKKAD